MRELPTHELPWKRTSELSESELYRARRDFALFTDVLGKVASRSKMRADALQSEISKRKNFSKTVTKDPERKVEAIVGDHAILRYLERSQGLDLAAIEKEIQDRVSQGESLLDGAIVIHEGMAFLRRPDGFIKTIIPEEWMDNSDKERALESFKKFEGE